MNTEEMLAFLKEHSIEYRRIADYKDIKVDAPDFYKLYSLLKKKKIPDNIRIFFYKGWRFYF